jgi:hypothetical protein
MGLHAKDEGLDYTAEDDIAAAAILAGLRAGSPSHSEVAMTAAGKMQCLCHRTCSPQLVDYISKILFTSKSRVPWQSWPWLHFPSRCMCL